MNPEQIQKAKEQALALEIFENSVFHTAILRLLKEELNISDETLKKYISKAREDSRTQLETVLKQREEAEKMKAEAEAPKEEVKND